MSSHEPFVRARLTRFSDGAQILPLAKIRVRIDTLDVPQNSPSPTSNVANRPKFSVYEESNDCFYFTTRTRQGRKVTIGVYVEANKTNYTYTTSIEDLIRSADQKIREVNFTYKKT